MARNTKRAKEAKQRRSTMTYVKRLLDKQSNVDEVRKFLSSKSNELALSCLEELVKKGLEPKPKPKRKAKATTPKDTGLEVEPVKPSPIVKPKTPRIVTPAEHVAESGRKQRRSTPQVGSRTSPAKVRKSGTLAIEVEPVELEY